MSEEDKKASADRMAEMKEKANKMAAAQAVKKGTVAVDSLRIRKDHDTNSDVVAGLTRGAEVTILETWSDGANTWARLENGWAAMVHNGETYIQAK
jgi:hypothetical protein